MPKRKPPPAAAVTRYAPASRLHGSARAAGLAPRGSSIYDVAERFAVNPRTALRYIQALQRAGEPLYEEMSGKRKVWRLMPTARRQTITLTTAQMVALFLSRRVFDFLAGTGFKEDLDDVFAQAGGDAAPQGLRGREEPGPQGLRRERGPAPLRGPPRGRERHHDRAAARGAPARHARGRVGRQEDVRPRAVHAARLQEGPVPGRAQRRATAASSARSRSTASARSNGCAARRSTTRPTSTRRSSPRGRSA